MRSSQLFLGVMLSLLSACRCDSWYCYISDPIDREPPTVEITRPADGAVLSTGNTFAVHVQVSDDVSSPEALHLYLYLDGEATCNTSEEDNTPCSGVNAVGSYHTDLPATEGAHELLAVVEDQSTAQGRAFCTFSIATATDTAEGSDDTGDTQSP